MLDRVFFCIDLAEVQSVGPATSPFQMTASKKIDEKAFFDVSATVVYML